MVGADSIAAVCTMRRDGHPGPRQAFKYHRATVSEAGVTQFSPVVCNGFLCSYIRNVVPIFGTSRQELMAKEEMQKNRGGIIAFRGAELIALIEARAAKVSASPTWRAALLSTTW